PSSAASSLLARFQVTTDAAGSGSLFIDDSARDTATDYTVDQVGNGLKITTDDGGLSVTLQDNAFKNGIALTTGGAANRVDVLATRAGESLTLNTKASDEHVLIGGGTVPNIRGDVIVTHTRPGGFTHLGINNLTGVHAAPEAAASGPSDDGPAPAGIRDADSHAEAR